MLPSSSPLCGFHSVHWSCRFAQVTSYLRAMMSHQLLAVPRWGGIRRVIVKLRFDTQLGVVAELKSKGQGTRQNHSPHSLCRSGGCFRLHALLTHSGRNGSSGSSTTLNSSVGGGGRSPRITSRTRGRYSTSDTLSNSSSISTCTQPPLSR